MDIEVSTVKTAAQKKKEKKEREKQKKLAQKKAVSEIDKLYNLFTKLVFYAKLFYLEINGVCLVNEIYYLIFIIIGTFKGR